jgi:hypothetical protein
VTGRSSPIKINLTKPYAADLIPPLRSKDQEPNNIAKAILA